MRNVRHFFFVGCLLSAGTSVGIATFGTAHPVGAASTQECVVVGTGKNLENTSHEERPPNLVTDTLGNRIGSVPAATAYSAQGKFAALTNFGTELSIGDIATGELTPVVDFEALDINYIYGLRFTPDGSHIGFIGRTPQTSLVDLTLFIVDIQGNETFRSQVFVENPGSYDFSPDSQWVVYTEDLGSFPGRDVFRAKVDGSGSPQSIIDQTSPDFALPPYVVPKSIQNLSYSPDGTKIAFDGRDAISNAFKTAAWHETYVMNADGSGLHEVGATPGVQESARNAPQWSPDGSRLSFFGTESVGGKNSSYVGVIDLAGDTITKVQGTTGLFGALYNHFHWSDSNNRIIANASIGYDDPQIDFTHGVFSIPADGGTPVRIVATESQPNNEWSFIDMIPCSLAQQPSYRGLTPERIMDTRSGLGIAAGAVLPGAPASLTVTGVGGVPAAGVTAVALNVTVTNTTSPSFLTVFPAGQAQPTASNVNWDRAGVTAANSVVVKVGDGGRVEFANAFGATDVIVDVAGWFAEGPGFTPISPVRTLDTRSGLGGTRPTIQSKPIPLQVHGSLVPDTATGVIMNVTAAEVTGLSFVTVWPGGASKPQTSNLNLAPGVTSANLTVTGIGENGTVSLNDEFNRSHLIGDIAGWLEPSSGYQSLQPTRVLDTRRSAPVNPGATIRVPLRQVDRGVPNVASVAILNVTSVDATAPSYLTVYPGGAERPSSSNVNFFPGQVVPNLVFATIGADGSIEIFNSFGTTNVIVDVVGYFG